MVEGNKYKQGQEILDRMTDDSGENVSVRMRMGALLCFENFGSSLRQEIVPKFPNSHPNHIFRL
jgi:hypothetical protein